MHSLEKTEHTPFEQLSIFLRAWVCFQLSDRMKYAVKAALAVMLSYLIPLSQGWEDGYTAAITVMLIASIGSVGESVVKGMLRVVGTVLGATLGMFLIASFPQERMLYLGVLSVMVTVILYLGRAYRGDKTIFLLTALTMMLVFKEGEVDEVFMYGINRTFMTVLGIVIYTLIGILLWPTRLEDQRSDNASKLSDISLELLKANGKERQKELVAQIIQLERQLQASTQSRSDTSSQMGISAAQWSSIVNDYTEVNVQLYILVAQLDAYPHSLLRSALTNYDEVHSACEALCEELPRIWREGCEISVPSAWEPVYDRDELSKISHLERAGVIQIAHTARRLLERLRSLAEKLNAMASPQPTAFDIDMRHKSAKFTWFDIEDLKGAVITFLIFWSSVSVWIWYNTPEGFAIAATATALSLVTTYSAARPSLLIILFTFSFAFAAAMYVFVLPYLHTGLQLGIFLFLYAFIGFYFFKAQLSIFFLLGMATLYITGDMIFNFNLFMLILLIFYLFLFILLFFDYVPFTMKPERMLLTLRRRFFFLGSALLEGSVKAVKNRASVWQKIKVRYALVHMSASVVKMKFWAQRLDAGYFSVDSAELLSFVKVCEDLGYHLRIYQHEIFRRRNNPLLLKAITAHFAGMVLSDALKQLAGRKRTIRISDNDMVLKALEEYLDDLFSDIDYSQYDVEVVAGFYELVNLNKNAWERLIEVQRQLDIIDFDTLKASRF